VEKGATKETARANSMGCMQPRSYIAHAFSFASKKYQIEENKTDIPRKVSESTAWTFEMVLLSRQGERLP
jgi:hypothetical protein